MTDGSTGQPSGMAPGPNPPAGGADSPWWSDALDDPWRDPYAPSAVVIRQPTEAAPPPALPEQQDGTIRGGMRLVVLVSVVTALIAGALGGTLGYVFAGRSGVGAALGRGDGRVAPLATRPPDSLAGVVRRVLPSVVTIRAGANSGFSLGSGFVISPDGYVLTNDHVIDGASGPVSVTFADASVATATVVGVDHESDIAVLRVAKSGLTPVTFGDSDQVAVGDPVLAFGSPLALSNTVTYGIVSALQRPIEATEPGSPTRYYAAIQTDAAINHGNSGGPLVDAAGRVIGVDSVIKSLASGTSDEGNIGLAFAIPINQAKRVAQDLINTGHARRTVIGAQFNSSFSSPTGGVQLQTVVTGGPAANAGLEPGDVIYKINGVSLGEPNDLIAVVREYAPGTAVAVQYQRDGVPRTVDVTLVADGQ